MSSVRWKKTAELPTLDCWLFPRGTNATLINFSSGYTFSLKVGNVGQTALLTKSSGITGAAGSGDGTAAADVPNVVVAWSSGELAITPGTYTAELTCTTSSQDRVFPFTVVIDDVIL